MARPDSALDAAALAGLIAILSALSPPVQANDATFGGRGSDLLPLQETRVRMVSEDIVLELHPVDETWRVTATYRFENPTDQAVRLQVGFPEERCSEGMDCTAMAGRFQNLVTTVRGVEVPQRAGTVAAHDEWAEQLGDVYLYDLTFTPHETVEVVHTYSYDRSYGIDWWGTRYLTRTGGLWAGPIGSARFTVRLPRPPWYVIYPAAFTLKRFEEQARPDGQGSTTELVFEAKSWAATEDFSVTFPASSIAAWVGDGLCPGWDATLTADELRPLFAELSAQQLRDCRNHLHALHGYPFKDPALRQRYYGAPPALPDWAKPGEFAIAGRGENKGFTPALFGPGEKVWLNTLVAEETRRGAR